MMGTRIRRHSAATYMLLLAILLGAASIHGEESLRTRYEWARDHYDLDAALSIQSQLSVALRDNAPADPVQLYVETCLLVAELYRIEFEEDDGQNRPELRRLGGLIDDAADQGLTALPLLPESSEKYRLEADLLGTKMRSKYQGKKHRKAMNTAINKARTLDPESARALITAAKPYLFGKDRAENYTKAIELLDEALTHDPQNERAYLLRGIAYEQMEDIAMARKDWNAALTINPASRPAKAALERITDY